MPAPEWVEDRRNNLRGRVTFAATRGDTLATLYPEIQEIVDILTTPLPASQVNPTEALRGVVSLQGTIVRS